MTCLDFGNNRNNTPDVGLKLFTLLNPFSCEASTFVFALFLSCWLDYRYFTITAIEFLLSEYKTAGDLMLFFSG